MCLCEVEINDFRGGLTDVSAVTKTMLSTTLQNLNFCSISVLSDGR